VAAHGLLPLLLCSGAPSPPPPPPPPPLQNRDYVEKAYAKGYRESDSYAQAPECKCSKVTKRDSYKQKCAEPEQVGGQPMPGQAAWLACDVSSHANVPVAREPAQAPGVWHVRSSLWVTGTPAQMGGWVMGLPHLLRAVDGMCVCAQVPSKTDLVWTEAACADGSAPSKKDNTCAVACPEGCTMSNVGARCSLTAQEPGGS